MRARTVVAAALVAASGALAAPIADAAPVTAPCMPYVRSAMRAGTLEVVSLRTLHVELESAKPTYSVGDTAVIEATVTRPAHEDPLGLGQPLDPPTSQPAGEINVGVGMRIGDVFLFGYAMTDENGHGKIRIKIKDYVTPGVAEADGYAWKTVADSPCARIEENGYKEFPKLFKVVGLR